MFKDYTEKILTALENMESASFKIQQKRLTMQHRSMLVKEQMFS